jgi:archaeosine synthase
MAGIGRTVISRQRYARIWGLGDRKNPIAHTPSLIINPTEDFSVDYAPFEISSDGQIPRGITIRSRGPFAPWITEENSPVMSASIGHVLPPSFEEADAGQSASKGDVLPISWQAMNHDEDLTNPDLDPIVVVLTDALQLANRPGKLVEAIVKIKHIFPSSLLWAPGISGPDNCAVLAWFGVDLFDTIRSSQAKSAGAILTWNGPRTMDSKSINHWENSLDEVRSAIDDNRLRDLAVAQSLNSPRLVEHMRYHDKIVQQQDGILSRIVENNRILQINSVESHNDPIIDDWVNFMINSYQAPNNLDDVLILLPCSARKPYSSSKSHKAFKNAISHNAAHEVMITSPLGLVPRDLEDTWPAAYYDIPVTGDWTNDEKERVENMLEALISRHNYRIIINHSSMNFQCGIPIINTRLGDGATSKTALERLSQAVIDNIRSKKRNGTIVNLEKYRSISRLQYLADTWLDGCEISGRFPRWKIMRDGNQIAMWAPERGSFSFSKAGIHILDETNTLRRLEIHETEKWKGDITLNILKSFDPAIRYGEDILVMQAGKCIGSARALAPAWEWKSTPGRLAKMHQRL